MQRIKLPIFLGILFLCNNSYAQTAHLGCENADEELAQVSRRMDDAQRSEYLNNLYADLLKIKPVLDNPPDGVSVNFLRRCLLTKRRAFDVNIAQARPSFGSSYDVIMRKALLSKAFANFDESQRYYELAIKLRPTDAGLRLDYFNVWQKADEQRLLKTSGTGVNAIDWRQHRSKYDEILEPILRMENAARDAKVTTLRLRASINTNLRQHNQVTKDMEQILNLDPSDKQALEYLVAFHCENRRYNPILCKKYLEAYVPRFPENIQATLLLLTLQYEEEDTSGALILSNRALEIHKTNNDLKAIRGLILWEVGRHKESQEIIESVLRQDPKNTWAIRARARNLFRQANEAQSKGMIGLSLKSLQDASTLMTDAGLENRRDAIEINERMALMIYDFLREKKFPSNSATKIDSNKIVTLLKPSFENATPKNNPSGLVDIFLHSIELSGAMSLSEGCKMLDQPSISLGDSNRAKQHCLGKRN